MVVEIHQVVIPDVLLLREVGAVTFEVENRVKNLQKKELNI